MNLQRYSVWPASDKGPIKSACVIGTFETVSMPLIYLKRPKHIKDDAVWGRILQSITLKLPTNFEVK